jgi:hypothetical protein
VDSEALGYWYLVLPACKQGGHCTAPWLHGIPRAELHLCDVERVRRDWLKENDGVVRELLQRCAPGGAVAQVLTAVMRAQQRVQHNDGERSGADVAKRQRREEEQGE